MKLGVMNNPSLNDLQKQQAITKIDIAAQKADWFLEVLKACGYVK